MAMMSTLPGDQAPDAAESVHSDLHHLVSDMRLAQHGSYGYLSNGQEQRASTFFMVQLSYPYMTTRKTIALARQTFLGKVMSLLFMLPGLS